MNNLTKLYIERKEEFNKGINPYNISDPPSDKEWLFTNQKSDILSVLDVIEKWGKENEKEYPSNDFNDGGDPEYRNRREAIDSRTTSSYNQALSDLLQFIKEAKNEIYIAY